MLTGLGYIINSILLVIILILTIRYYMDSRLIDPGQLPGGPVIVEVSDRILDKLEDLIKYRKRQKLLIGSILTGIMLFAIIKKVLI
ncbi:MAG: hypothetical protein ACQEQC_00075 [Elusimicrobiota bacterium]